MNGRATARIESTLDAGASALLAAAVAYALYRALSGSQGSTVATLTGEALAFGLCFAGLRQVKPEQRRVRRSRTAAGLAETTSPPSRVVQLFGPGRVAATPSFDASQSLYDALAELRRSLN